MIRFFLIHIIDIITMKSPIWSDKSFKDIIEELTQIADTSNTRVEIISDDFEEGSMLFSAFGGVAAVLRYPTGM